jgi:hypothetical protein
MRRMNAVSITWLKANVLSPVALALLLTGESFAETPGACRSIHEAAVATLNAPGGLRQYLAARDGDPERLISVVTDDSVYMALSTGRWSRESRAVHRALAADTERLKKLSDCRLVGRETLDGEPVTVFQYTVQFLGLAPIPAKAWIGADGLLRRESTARRGLLRYEYKNISRPDDEHGKASWAGTSLQETIKGQ